MRFHLTDSECQVLHGELLDFVIDFDVKQMIKQLLVHNELKARLPLGVTSTDSYIAETITICCDSGYTLDPPVLLGIVDKLHEAGRHRSRDLLRARLLTPPRQTVASHPLESTLLYGRLAFANRSHLRQILREFDAEANFKKILHINGGRGSGRSWTSQLIDYHCARTKGRHLHCETAVTEDNGAAMGPRELARDLAGKLGSDLSDCPEPLSNEDAWITDLAQWVIAQANAPQIHLGGHARRVWFVFDGFRDGVLRHDAAKFMTALARLCTSGVAAQMHRVVFCEFDYDVASRIKLKVQRYDIEPVHKRDIRDILSEVIAGNTSIPEDLRDSVVDETMEIVTGDAAEPFDDLTEIGARLQEVIEESMA